MMDFISEDRKRELAVAEMERRLHEYDRLRVVVPDLVAVLKKVLDRDMRNTCDHTETHRGGVMWEICEACGAKWADDEGGKPAWEDPPEWAEAFSIIQRAESE